MQSDLLSILNWTNVNLKFLRIRSGLPGRIQWAHGLIQGSPTCVFEGHFSWFPMLYMVKHSGLETTELANGFLPTLWITCLRSCSKRFCHVLIYNYLFKNSKSNDPFTEYSDMVHITQTRTQKSKNLRNSTDLSVNRFFFVFTLFQAMR